MTRRHLRLTYILFTGLLLPAAGFSQTRNTDSLLQRVHHAAGQLEKLDAMLALCDEYQNLDRDTLNYYAYRLKELADQSGNKKKISLAAIALANCYSRWGWTDSAVAAITPVIEKNRLSLPEERAIHFKAARQKALYYGGKGKYPESLAILYRLVSDAEKYNDTPVISANMNTIGSIALQRESPTGALTWFTHALSYVSAGEGFEAIKAAIYVNMGDGYFLIGNKDSAIYYSEKGIRLFRKVQNLASLALALQRQSNIFRSSGNAAKAEAALKEMIEVRGKTNDRGFWADDNLTLIDFYLASRQVDKAIAFCLQCLASGDPYKQQNGKAIVYANAISVRLSYYDALAKCYKAKGDVNRYQQTLEKILLAKDSFFTAQSEEAIAEVQTKYEVQKKENTIIQQELTIARKNNLVYMLISAGIVIAGIACVSFWLYRRRQRSLAVRAVADAEENERKRIAADLHDNLGAYAASIASNLDMLRSGDRTQSHPVALQELDNNSQSMVAQLSDTIWALNKDSLKITAISDRTKVFLQRIGQSHAGIEMDVKENIVHDVSLPPTQAFHLFRMIQEAVTNAMKHSGASHITVLIEGDLAWSVTIADNGKGMTVRAFGNEETGSGNGLRNMRERASAAGWYIGWMSNIPTGTKVVIRPVI